MNPNLTNCLFCKVPISRQASTCPKCGRSQQVLGKCEMCSGPYFNDEVGKWFYGPQSVWSGNQRIYRIHARCIQPLVSRLVNELSVMKCPDCGSLVSIATAMGGPIYPEPSQCQSCGCPFRSIAEAMGGGEGVCCICGLPIYRAIQAIGKFYQSIAHDVCKRRLGLFR